MQRLHDAARRGCDGVIWPQPTVTASVFLERIEKNLGTADVDLNRREFGRIEAELAKIEIHGNRTDEDIAKLRDLH